MSGNAEDWYNGDVATFGDRLAAAREASGMDQETLARRIGVKSGTLRNWENDTAEPRANRLQMMSGILGVSIVWLLTGEGDGVDGPEDEPHEDRDLRALLAELRTLRSGLVAKAEEVGRLEKRVRNLLRAAESV